MNNQRRRYRLASSEFSDVDLHDYEDLIIDTINNTVPNKNPKVFKDHYSTDILSHSEAVAIGRALSKVPELQSFVISIALLVQVI